jgi:hypothetical protein
VPVGDVLHSPLVAVFVWLVRSLVALRFTFILFFPCAWAYIEDARFLDICRDPAVTDV